MFDGIVISSLCSELNKNLLGGRISKIAMPEKDELILTIKNDSQTHRLLISVNASLPLMYLSDENKPSPATALGFCMLLRKYISSGVITRIEQMGLERIVRVSFDHRNELGDLDSKYMYIELMGKHSNIIFTTTDDIILDSIKHISLQTSSLREVLPTRKYFLPEKLKKVDPFTLDVDAFTNILKSESMPLDQILLKNISGISPLIADEICVRANISSISLSDALDTKKIESIFHALQDILDDIRAERFSPNIVYQNEEPKDFSAIKLHAFSDEYRIKYFTSMSELLYEFYSEKEKISRIRQKTADLRKILSMMTERTSKKLDLQQKQLDDTDKKDKYKVYGDLINTYGYELKGGEDKLICENYYDDGKLITIPLDINLTATENASKYFARYNKLKRTREAVLVELEKNNQSLEHLRSISLSLELATTESDIDEIKQEMVESGLIKKSVQKRKVSQKVKIEPLHFLSSDGDDIYVGKNNIQNEYITFKLASGNDWWFHAKGIPGSHVVVKSRKEKLSDSTFEEAASLAALYSSAKAKIEIDYIQRKNLKKVNGAALGFVIYHTNYSMVADPDIAKSLKQVN